MENKIDELLKKKQQFDKENATEAELVNENNTTNNSGTEDVYRQSEANFWGDVEIEENKAPLTEKGTADTDKKVDEVPKNNISDKTLRASAETTAYVIKNTVEITGELGLAVQFSRKRKKISDLEEELDTIENALEAEIVLEEIDLEKKKLRLKRLMKKYGDKTEENKVSTSEIERLTDAWYNYYKITQKSMSPETILYCEMINILAPRTMNVFFDW